MCNSTLLEIKNTLAENVFEARYGYDDKEQVINFKDLFEVKSWDQNSAEFECTNITYTLTREDWKTYIAAKESGIDYAVAEENWD